ncbi:MAG: M14 family zinc carboxypeptidase [Actinomycetota bacterium]
MNGPLGRPARTWVSIAVTLVLAVPALAIITTSAGAQLAPPWDGNPISPGLGPTYGETWCADAAPGSSIANQQGDPLALIPYEAIACTLDQFNAEAAAAGIPNRMSYSVIGQSSRGHNLYGVVVNALETPQQQRDSERWFTLRSIMTEDPAKGQNLLKQWGSNVKVPIFVEANIHGGEEEGTDAMMQVISDLVTLPYGTNAAVDSLLDHAILIVIPVENPDGRIAGTRANGNGFDMNRDLLVQSQSEIRANIAFQLQWLAPVGLFMHGYVNPTLIDGLTKPHNPGLEYDLFLKWNQPRLDANEAALADVGMGITRPVNEWNADAEEAPPPVGPAYAEGWDDWGPFYTQTYAAFFGVDGSTLEMCNNIDVDPGCNGRFGSKRAQYVGFYSSAGFWLDNRNEILTDQLEIFRRGVEGAARPNCCDSPDILSRGFTEDQHNWMVPYMQAFVIPFNGGGQRSDGEANRLVQWLLDNGILVESLVRPASFGGTTFPRDSYVVWMDQALRGLALTALDEGQDISDRISQLYAPPGAWSHGQLWGADVVEIPSDAPFAARTRAVTEPKPLTGGIQGGNSSWYSLTLRGVSEVRAVLDLLRDGIDGEVAEESFTNSSGFSPAGTVIFPADAATAAALAEAGASAGVVFERNRGAEPATSELDEAPRVAILVNSSAPAINDTYFSLRRIFGNDADFVSVVDGTNSLQNAVDDPLANYDVIYNAGQNYPSSTNETAQARLQAFFARGGGYIGTSQSANNFAFLTGAGLVTSPLTQTSDSAGGGIARWSNAGLSGPVTGGYSAQDFLYLPSNVTYFSAVPTGGVVDGTYLPDTTSMFVAGLWLDRDPAAAGAPMAVHGDTTVASRYVALAANPFSRGDAEREWLLMGQAALWSNLTDEA